MEKGKLKILVKILLCLLITTILAYVVITISGCINIYNDIYTSFPWYTPIVLNGMIFIIPILLESLLFIYFLIRSKKN